MCPITVADYADPFPVRLRMALHMVEKKRHVPERSLRVMVNLQHGGILRMIGGIDNDIAMAGEELKKDGVVHERAAVALMVD